MVAVAVLEREKEGRGKAYRSKENLLRSTLSSGAVMRSTSWPISVWYDVSWKRSSKSA